MSGPEKFSRREVQRSFRKFNDLVADLLSSQYQIWDDVLTRLLSHCESDPVMQVVTSPLKSNCRVNAEQWWKDAIQSVRGMVGSGQYSLPSDDDERTALLYQVLLLIKHRNVDLAGFCNAVYGVSKYQDMVDIFNNEIVHKFTREMRYRLDEVTEDIGDQHEIARESVVIFHHHDHSTNIAGAVQGSNVATGNASISHASATFGESSEIASAIRELKSLAVDLSGTNRATVESLLDSLADRAQANEGDREEIAECVKAIAEISPTIRSRLLGLVSNVGTSVAGSMIIEAIKLALGG